MFDTQQPLNKHLLTIGTILVNISQFADGDTDIQRLDASYFMDDPGLLLHSRSVKSYKFFGVKCSQIREPILKSYKTIHEIHIFFYCLH